MSNHLVPATAGGMPAPTRRAVLTGAAASVALLASADALLASLPTWMEIRIEVHQDALRAYLYAVEVFSIHDAALIRSPYRSGDAELKAADEAMRLASEREGVALRALLAERPRTLADAELRARYLMENVRDDLDGEPEFLGLLLGSMTGREG